MAGGLDLSRPAAERASRPSAVWLAAGFVPAVILAGWRVLVPAPSLSGDGCGDLLAPVVLWRLGLFAAVMASVALLARWLPADRVSLRLLWPSRLVVGMSVAVVLVIGPLALWLGPIVAEPFFGAVSYGLGSGGVVVTAFVAALVVALANGMLEEVAFRGALMGWGSRALGPFGANVVQALVFGVVHVGADFTADPWPVLVTVAAGGFIAGVIARRTNSLLLPIAVHAAFDLPLYYAFACRLG
jgi:membrane protease YdiL (CAAX protease family)